MVDAVTIARAWIAIADTLRDDEQRGLFYSAVCHYAVDGRIPNLKGNLKIFFDLIRPDIDKSRARRLAQQKSLQIRWIKRSQNLQNGLQNDLQTDLQNGLQNDLQNSLENASGKIVRLKPAKNNLQTDSQTDLQSDLQNGMQNDSNPSSPASSPSLSPNNTPTQPGINAPAPDARKIEPSGKPEQLQPITFADRLPRHLRTPEVMAKWREWEDFRRRIKGKKISVMAAARQIAMLASYEPAQAIAIIEQSIANDYQGLFPLKGVKPRKTSDKPI